VKFYFPDSQDHVDPSFDFETEERSETRIRQRDDLYAHEIFESPPFDGLLVSKAIVDGEGGISRYTLGQRRRLYFEGVRRFLHLEETALKTLGDCGAFSYKDEDKPPYTVHEVLDFYETCGFDYGFSVDHMIGAYKDEKNLDLPGFDIPEDWVYRKNLTLELAHEFLEENKKQKCRVGPIGVAQGWSPASYRESVLGLQKMGYSYVALGGIVPLKTYQILDVLQAISDIRKPETRLHLLGVTRLDRVNDFSQYGVYSFDSTSPLMQGLKSNRHNYYAPDGSKYSSIAVPQIDGNNQLRNKIRSGVVDQGKAIKLEQQTLQALIAYDKGQVSLDQAFHVLQEYEQICQLKDRDKDNYRTLSDRPWRSCDCAICKQLGIHVLLKRGAERNRRRGLHNVYITYKQLQNELGSFGQKGAAA
jgi:hypothetical protein